MKKARSDKPPKPVASDKPAPTATKTDSLRPIEQGHRQMIHVLKKVAAGEPDAAIGLANDLLNNGFDPSAASVSAMSVVAMLDARIERDEATQRGRKQGGATTGDQKKKEAADGKARIQGYATMLLRAGNAPRDVVRLIYEEYGITRPRIYRALRDHPSGHWKKKQ
jgi:hypothetical protein